MRQGIQSRGARQKKLNPKAGQPILREDQIDSAEYDSLQNPTKVTSAGVEARDPISTFHHRSLC